MLNKVVTFAVLFQMVMSCRCARLIPVYDINTEERFAFPEDFLKLVLEYQLLDETEDSQYSIPDQLDGEGCTFFFFGRIFAVRRFNDVHNSMTFTVHHFDDVHSSSL